MSSYILVLFVHIASSTLLLGTSIVGEPVVRAAARRVSRAQELRAVLEVGRRMALVSPVAAMLLLASGIYLTSVGWAWSVGWIQVSMALFVVNSVVAMGVVKPTIERVAAEVGAASGDSMGPDLDGLRWSGAWTWGVDVLATNDAVMLYVMIMKPSLGGSLSTLLLAYAAVAGARIVLGRRRPGTMDARSSGFGRTREHLDATRSGIP